MDRCTHTQSHAQTARLVSSFCVGHRTMLSQKWRRTRRRSKQYFSNCCGEFLYYESDCVGRRSFQQMKWLFVYLPCFFFFFFIPKSKGWFCNTVVTLISDTLSLVHSLTTHSQNGPRKASGMLPGLVTALFNKYWILPVLFEQRSH